MLRSMCGGVRSAVVRRGLCSASNNRGVVVQRTRQVDEVDVASSTIHPRRRLLPAWTRFQRFQQHARGEALVCRLQSLVLEATIMARTMIPAFDESVGESRESGVVRSAPAMSTTPPASGRRVRRRHLTPTLVRAVVVDPQVLAKSDAPPSSVEASIDAFGDIYRLPRHTEIVVISRLTARDASLDALEKYVLATVDIVRSSRNESSPRTRTTLRPVAALKRTTLRPVAS